MWRNPEDRIGWNCARLEFCEVRGPHSENGGEPLLYGDRACLGAKPRI